MLVYAWALSDIGRKRGDNQDAFLIAHELKLFAVADGMGGHKGGAVASDLAVRTLEENVRQSGGDAATRLARSVQAANRRIHELAQRDPELDNMGTTTSSLLFTGDRAVIAHVGDSRVYLVRGRRIVQLTDNHSFVFQQLKAGLITEEQAQRSPYRNIIMRGVGIAADVEVDIVSVEVCSADTFVICSDGLSSLVRDEEIRQAVDDNFLHRVPEVLVDLANERGGNDNITVVVAYAVDEAEMALAAAASGG